MQKVAARAKFLLTLLIIAPNLRAQDRSGAEPVSTNSDAADSDQPVIKPDPLKLYQKLFEMQRVEHLTAVKAILKLPDIEKKVKLVGTLLEQMEKVIKDGRVEVEKSGFLPGSSPFPDPNSESGSLLKEPLSRILENTAFFAELSLRLPDIAGKYYQKNKEFQTAINWSIGFSNSTGFYTEKTLKLLNLAGQELGLVEKSPDFVNPYRNSGKKREKTLTPEQEAELRKQKREKEDRERKLKKKGEKKGPRLSGKRSDL